MGISTLIDIEGCEQTLKEIFESLEKIYLNLEDFCVYMEGLQDKVNGDSTSIFQQTYKHIKNEIDGVHANLNEMHSTFARTGDKIEMLTNRQKLDFNLEMKEIPKVYLTFRLESAVQAFKIDSHSDAKTIVDKIQTFKDGIFNPVSGDPGSFSTLVEMYESLNDSLEGTNLMVSIDEVAQSILDFSNKTNNKLGEFNETIAKKFNIIIENVDSSTENIKDGDESIDARTKSWMNRTEQLKSLQEENMFLKGKNRNSTIDINSNEKPEVVKPSEQVPFDNGDLTPPTKELEVGSTSNVQNYSKPLSGTGKIDENFSVPSPTGISYTSGLSQNQLSVVYGVISAEAGPSATPAECANVASAIVNRVNGLDNFNVSDIYASVTDTNPVQFTTYRDGLYVGQALTPEQQAAVDAVFSGGNVTHNYTYFVSNGSVNHDPDTHYQLEEKGNRYSHHW